MCEKKKCNCENCCCNGCNCEQEKYEFSDEYIKDLLKAINDYERRQLGIIRNLKI